MTLITMIPAAAGSAIAAGPARSVAETDHPAPRVAPSGAAHIVPAPRPAIVADPSLPIAAPSRASRGGRDAQNEPRLLLSYHFKRAVYHCRLEIRCSLWCAIFDSM